MPSLLPPSAGVLQALFDNSAVGIAVTRERRIVCANACMARLFGYEAAALPGLPGATIFLTEDAYAAFGDEVGPALARGESIQRDLRLRHRDGHAFWCRLYGCAAAPDDPAAGTLWIIFESDSEHRAREQAEHIQQEQDTVFETLVDGVVIVRDRVIQHCNHRFEELLGYAPGAMNGLSTRIWYVSDADFAGIGAEAYQDLRERQQHAREQIFLRADGSIFWGRFSGRAFDNDHPHAGSVWILEDISDRKEREAQVRAALGEQELIFDNAAVGILLLKNRIIERCNRRFEEDHGYAPGEMNGRSTAILFVSHDEYLAFGERAYPVMQRGEVFVSEREAVRKDGSRFWVRTTGRWIDSGEGESGAIWILEDVSERKQMEVALLEARADLERRVAQRTSELAGTNARLQAEIFERMQAEERIWHIAHHDELTGLPNRSLLIDRLQQTIARAQRYNRQAAVLFIDLDRFKHINDTLGHDVGDRFLVAVARRLEVAVRSSDTVARLGGDEFIVILQDVDGVDDVTLVGEKLIASFEAPVDVSGVSLRTTASIGIGIFPEDGRAVPELMRNADTAMYHAKAAGRNNFQFFAASMNAAASRFFSLEQQLRAAIGTPAFLLHYQPLVDLKQGQVCGFEALLRWVDDSGTLISPAEFIPVAEETGLILPLGEWVLAEACRQRVEWNRQGRPPLPIAVNLSARQFVRRSLVDDIRRIIAESGMPPQQLELEITESMLMSNVDEILPRLHELAEMGVSLAIDDFGTGYSSLAYLKRFPVAKLKIDRSFVRDICDDREDAAIVSAIVALGRSLDIRVLAEGVETGEQLAALQAAGCGYCQGFLFSRPLAPDFADRLHALPWLESAQPLGEGDTPAGRAGMP